MDNNTNSTCKILKNVLYECEKSNKIDDCIIYSESNKYESSLKDLTELNYLTQHKYDDNFIKDLLEKCSKCIKESQHYSPVVVFEGNHNSLMKYAGFFELVYNSKQYKITTIIITSYDSLPQEIMHNIDATIIPFHANINIQKKIYEKFKGMYPVFKAFQHNLLKCSSNTSALCINNRLIGEKSKKYFMEIKNDSPTRFLLPHNLDTHVKNIYEIFNVLNTKCPSIQIIGHENKKIAINILCELESRERLTSCVIYSSHDKSRWSEYDDNDKYYIINPLDSVDFRNTLSQICNNSVNHSHENHVVVFDHDDILNDEQYFNTFSNFIMNSRHYNIISIFTTDKLNLNFSIGCNFDVNMICFNPDKKVQQMLYDQYGRIFPTFDSFSSYFHAYTKNEKVCVFMNKLSKNFNDSFCSAIIDENLLTKLDKKSQINPMVRSILSLVKNDIDEVNKQQMLLDKLMASLI